MVFADRMKQYGTGIFSAMAELKRQELAAGKRVTDLSIGTPNIPPAQHITDALARAAADSRNYVYALNDTEELKDAVAAWYRRRYGVTIDPETEMTSLLGSQDGLAHLGLTLLNPGDLALVPDPGYPIFADGPALAGARLYRMPQKRESGWIIDLEAIPEEVAREAKFMVVSYPNNPVTSVAPPEFYRSLVAFAKKYGIVVLHDNAYSELVFDGLSCGSFLQYDGARDVGVEFNSLSKTYGLAGARIGFAVGSKDVVAMLKALKSNLDYGMFLPVQKAAAAALNGPQDCVAATRLAYQRRRDVLVDGLNAIGWAVEKPKATMFVWAKLPAPFTDSGVFTERLLRRAGVLVTPGAAFGPSGEGYVRIALAQDEEEMRAAVRAVAKSGILNG